MRLIDVDKLGVGRCSEEVLPHDHCLAWNTLIGMIENAPTVDAMPVVRCRDCAYFGYDKFGDAGCCAPVGLNVPDKDSFCSYGKRREADDSEKM